MNVSLPPPFNNCGTKDELRDLYKRLAMEMHPDTMPGASKAKPGYDPAIEEKAKRDMQELNRLYSVAMALLIRADQPSLSEAEYQDAEDVAEAVRAAVERIINLPDIEIEIRGSWVWVFGETKAVRAQLKAAGYKWLPAKERQPWAFMGVKSNGRGQWSHEEIIERYGSQKVSRHSRGGRQLAG